MIDGAEEYRVEPGLGRNAGDQTNIFSIDGDRRLKLKSWRVHVKDRLQVAICEPVEVDDDGDIFEDSGSTEQNRIFVPATRSKHPPHALHDSTLA